MITETDLRRILNEVAPVEMKNAQSQQPDKVAECTTGACAEINNPVKSRGSSR